MYQIKKAEGYLQIEMFLEVICIIELQWGHVITRKKKGQQGISNFVGYENCKTWEDGFLYNWNFTLSYNKVSHNQRLDLWSPPPKKNPFVKWCIIMGSLWWWLSYVCTITYNASLIHRCLVEFSLEGEWVSEEMYAINSWFD